jgi:hypothetical protein
VRPTRQYTEFRAQRHIHQLERELDDAPGTGGRPGAEIDRETVDVGRTSGGENAVDHVVDVGPIGFQTSIGQPRHLAGQHRQNDVR